jgi:glycosyltransferase involved in cell wall biosynthesis
MRGAILPPHQTGGTDLNRFIAVAPKIRVLHIITRLDMGGSAQNTLLSCLGLDPALYSVTLVKGSTVESNMTREEVQRLERDVASARRKGVTVITIPTLVRRIAPWNDLRAFLAILRHIRASKPDIVHTHTSKAGLLGRVAAWLARVPLIVHTPHGHVFYGHFGPGLSRIFLEVERMLGCITNHLIALTPGEAEDYVDLGVMPPHKISVIPSGIDLRRFAGARVDRLSKRRELGLPPAALAVGFVGWLLPIKGLSFLVRAMPGILARHPESLLVLVGKGAEEVKLRSLADSLGLNGRVLFMGWRPDVEEILPCLDLLVLPSLNEGMGRVLVEAMAAGVPIVASRIGGVPDLIWDGKNGLLVPPADCGALEQAISTLLADEPTRRRMAARGKGICAQYSAEGMVDQISDLYALLQNVLSPQGLSGAILAKSHP